MSGLCGVPLYVTVTGVDNAPPQFVYTNITYSCWRVALLFTTSVAMISSNGSSHTMHQVSYTHDACYAKYDEATMQGVVQFLDRDGHH